MGHTGTSGYTSTAGHTNTSDHADASATSSGATRAARRIVRGNVDPRRRAGPFGARPVSTPLRLREEQPQLSIRGAR
jgi:hypothetical protein